MDNVQTLDKDGDTGGGQADVHASTIARAPALGGDERRMHVRAYNFWVSLLQGRPLPSIDALDPARARDFSDHGVLLDFTDDPADPAISYLGAALRAEGDIAADIAHISNVPERSLLARLTDHYLQILENRAPIGFEAEFVNARGNNTLYRGILMPFSSDGLVIDHVYGVINWKEVSAAPAADAAPKTTATVAGSRDTPATPSWADGPGAQLPAPQLLDPPASPWSTEGIEAPQPLAASGDEDGLADCLAAARNTADMLHSAEVRTRSALYRAIGLAYDFACAAEKSPGEYARLLAGAGIRVQRRAPMTAVAKLVFGSDYDKTRLTEFATVLAHGRRQGLASGAMRRLLEGQEGGLKAIVATERAVRRPQQGPTPAASARAVLRSAEPRVTIDLPCGESEFILLIARRDGDGRAAVVGQVPEDAALMDRAIRRLPR